MAEIEDREHVLALVDWTSFLVSLIVTFSYILTLHTQLTEQYPEKTYPDPVPFPKS